MSQHTPGPWKHNGLEVWYGASEESKKDALPVAVWAANGERFICSTRHAPGKYQDEPPEIAAANARLIAAAPAMREALHGLNWLSSYERDGFCCCPRGDGHVVDQEHSTACQQARAVLRAIEGA